MPRADSSSGLAAVLRAPARDFLEERHGEEVPQPVDARIIRSMAVFRVELAEASVPIAAELIEPALVARIVDRGGDARSTLRREEDVVVRGALRRKLHHVSTKPMRWRSLTR
jgi:hypothetical protein